MRQLKLIATLATILLIPAIAIANPKFELPNVDKVRQEETPGEKPTAFVYPDNSDKKVGDFQATRKKLQELRLKHPNGKIRQIKLVSYAEFNQEMTKTGSSVVESSEIHPKRQIFMVDIEQPDAEVSDRRGRSQKLKNVRIKQGYDAETGAILGSEIFGESVN